MQEAVHGIVLCCSCTKPACPSVSSSSCAAPTTVSITRPIQKVGRMSRARVKRHDGEIGCKLDMILAN